MKKIIKYSNGLKVVYIPNKKVHAAALGIFVGASLIREKKGQEGISHFIEHMLFKSTTNRSAFDIVNELDSIGATVNAYTAKNYTCFYTLSLDSHFEKCMDVLSDMYFNPKFDKEEFEKEKQVIFEEMNESEDDPDDLCTENLTKVFYGNNKLGKEILGTKKSLSKMAPQDLLEYHNMYYVPENTVISVSGNVDEKMLLTCLDKYFIYRFSTRNEIKHTNIPSIKTYSKAVSSKKDIEQSHIAIGFPSYGSNDYRSRIVTLLSIIFSTEMSSRLFQKVREELGLCYSVYGYQSSYQNNGMYIITLSTSPSKVETAVKAIKEEIKLLLREGVSDEELNKSKEMFKTSLVLGQESTMSQAKTYGAYAIQYNKLLNLEKVLGIIDGTTKEDILEVAKYIFDFTKVSTSIVGPDNSTDILSILKD